MVSIGGPCKVRCVRGVTWHMGQLLPCACIVQGQVVLAVIALQGAHGVLRKGVCSFRQIAQALATWAHGRMVRDRAVAWSARCWQCQPCLRETHRPPFVPPPAWPGVCHPLRTQSPSPGAWAPASICTSYVIVPAFAFCRSCSCVAATELSGRRSVRWLSQHMGSLLHAPKSQDDLLHDPAHPPAFAFLEAPDSGAARMDARKGCCEDPRRA